MSTQTGEAAAALRSVLLKRTSRRGVATRRDPIHFGTGGIRKETKSVLWGKVRALYDGNSEGKDGTTTV